MSKSLRVPGLVAFALALACQPLTSRADCVDGVRDATAGEQSFSARASASLAAAIPAPTVNAVRRGAPFNFKAPPRTGGGCRGTPEGGFEVSEQAGYLYTFPRHEHDRVGAERRAVVERIRAIEALPPDKEAERKALEDQARAVYAQGPRRSRRDPPFTAEQQAESNRKTAEGDALMQKSREVTFEHVKSVRALVEPLRAEEKRLETFPQEFVVSLQMNVAKPPSPVSALDRDVMVLGAPAPARSAGFRVVNVVLELRGPQGPARKALLDSIDMAWLQGLIGKPPPEVAASEANAVRLAALPPATVAAVPSTTLVALPAAGAPAVAPQPSAPPAAPQASPAPSAPAPSAPTPAAQPAPAPAPPVASAPAPAPAPAQPGTPPANCPPPASAQGGQAANAGAAIGGAVLGGGFGRNLGSMIGGAVGAVTGSATPGCPT
jgi:hypothetical protein